MSRHGKFQNEHKRRKRSRRCRRKKRGHTQKRESYNFLRPERETSQNQQLRKYETEDAPNCERWGEDTANRAGSEKQSY